MAVDVGGVFRRPRLCAAVEPAGEVAHPARPAASLRHSLRSGEPGGRQGDYTCTAFERASVEFPRARGEGKWSAVQVARTLARA